MYCMYLRKSRADVVDESIEETLSRHENILNTFAESQNIRISKIFREVVSGESIKARPQMQTLLKEVANEIYDGVLVVEIERLGRGNSIDQGIITQTFQFSNTKIITPTKTYDLSNDMDQTYSEFGMFMSRQEYKTINRRLQRGRKLSQSEGKFVGSVPSYGYKVKHLKKGCTLEPNPKEAKLVKQMYQWYVDEGIGASLIANRLNDAKIKTRKGKEWIHSGIYEILRNEVYIGKIRTGRRRETKTMQNGEVIKMHKRYNDYVLIDGQHEPLVSEDTFMQAQKKMKEMANPRYKRNTTLQNPFATLLKCAKCGRAIVRRPYADRKASLICTFKGCKNVGSDIDIVETKLIEALETKADEYRIEVGKRKKSGSKESFQESALNAHKEELDKVKKTLDSLCEYLETGAYTIEMFKKRKAVIMDKKKELEANIASLEAIVEKQGSGEFLEEFIQNFENAIEMYKNTDNIEVKNKILQQILVKVEYEKDIGGRWTDPNNFTLIIYPRI